MIILIDSNRSLFSILYTLIQGRVSVAFYLLRFGRFLSSLVTLS